MSTLTTIQATDLITNSRANINDNFAALNTEKIETSVLDTDTTLAANSDAKVATQRAVKAYVDGNGNADIVAAQQGGGDFGAPSAANKFVTENLLGEGLSQVYTITGSPHTWTKPENAKAVLVRLWSAGAGGANGSVGNNQVASGGGGGMYLERLLAASQVGATETITVGAGGTAGNAGGDTSFGTLAVAKGGAAPSGAIGGAGGGVFSASAETAAFGEVGGSGVSAAAGVNAERGGAAGGGSDTAGTAGAGGGSLLGAGGGGGGGATYGTSGTQRSGGAGGRTGFFTAGGGAAGGGGVDDGTAGNGTTATTPGGGGGGGGACDTGANVAGNGGNGLGGDRVAGGGGGGGGSSRVGGTAGTGGTGGDGYAEIITFF